VKFSALNETIRKARILITTEEYAKDSVYALVAQVEPPEELVNINKDLLKITVPMSAKSQMRIHSLERSVPLKGRYRFLLKVYLLDPEDQVLSVRLTLVGAVYGLAGTDDYRSDLFAGLVWGTRVSLLVGVMTSVLSVLFGVFYGVLSAYLGGWTDEALQRVNEIVASIPLLPILILLASLFKPSVWNIVLILVVFGWTGTAKVVRSMGYQLKEADYVEAARAMGAGWRWIVFRHMMPQILPYTFASMALSVPGAILAEAGISFLGLGDIERVTWGQILHDAQKAAAALKGMWWWVIPPGLAIALVGLAFVLLGTALDRVLNPKMRTL